MTARRLEATGDLDGRRSPPKCHNPKGAPSSSGNPPMSFSVHCHCGQTLPVRAAQAGTSIVCVCGSEVRVPSLKALKASVEVSQPAELNHELLIRDGKVQTPPEDKRPKRKKVCPLCATSNVVR